MAFLSAGAKLAMNSLNLGDDSIPPMLNTKMAATEVQPRMECPDKKSATEANRVPTTMLVVARIKPLKYAKMKQLVMMRPALRLSMPSGKIWVPSLLRSRKNFQKAPAVSPPAWEKNFT